jgi:hypothetical protein
MPPIPVEIAMNLFDKTNLPMTIVVVMILWAWFSLFSVVLGSLF